MFHIYTRYIFACDEGQSMLIKFFVGFMKFDALYLFIFTRLKLFANGALTEFATRSL